jgi:hypothetical protein
MNWLQLGYQYGVGGLFFAVTLILCFRGANSKNRSDHRARLACVAGLAGYFLFHLTWITLASM